MKILLVANYIPSQQESMQKFANLMVNLLVNTEHDIKVIRPKAILCKSQNAESGLVKWLGYIDRFILFKSCLKANAKWADVVHICDHSNAMYAKWLGNKPHIVTCHDMMAIQSALGQVTTNKTSFTGKLFQKWISSGLRSSQHVVCVSKNTQQELIKTLALKKENISVVYNARNYPYFPMNKKDARQLVQQKIPNLITPFFFHLGGNQWYKNRKGIVDIFSHLINYSEFKEHKLILAGKPWPNDLKAKVQYLDLQDRILELTNLSNEEIRGFYSLAEALIFPSLQEGFGWPIAEAQACGCTVITTNRAPMTEVGGDAAIYISPESPIESAEIIHNKLTRDENSIDMNLQNAARFSSDTMLKGYLDKYNKVNNS